MYILIDPFFHLLLVPISNVSLYILKLYLFKFEIIRKHSIIVLLRIVVIIIDLFFYDIIKFKKIFLLITKILRLLNYNNYSTIIEEKNIASFLYFMWAGGQMKLSIIKIFLIFFLLFTILGPRIGISRISNSIFSKFIIGITE